MDGHERPRAAHLAWFYDGTTHAIGDGMSRTTLVTTPFSDMSEPDEDFVSTVRGLVWAEQPACLVPFVRATKIDPPALYPDLSTEEEEDDFPIRRADAVFLTDEEATEIVAGRIPARLAMIGRAALRST